jgi:predicted nucleic acid-binding Zn ribbon protein
VITLEKALKRALNIPSIRRRLNVAQISDSWEGLVGEVVARHVRPISLEKGVLTLEADSSVWRQQISLSKERIQKRIREKFDAEIVRVLRIK